MCRVASVEFKETDVRRAVKAIDSAGKPIAGVRFYPDGSFTVLTGKLTQATDLSANPWDEVLIDEADQKRPS